MFISLAATLALIVSAWITPCAVPPNSLTLPPCLNDEVTPTNCYWDAHTMGNKLGDSFVVIDGQAYYPVRPNE